jgi:hypothetical protein
MKKCLWQNRAASSDEQKRLWQKGIYCTLTLIGLTKGFGKKGGNCSRLASLDEPKKVSAKGWW